MIWPALCLGYLFIAAAGFASGPFGWRGLAVCFASIVGGLLVAHAERGRTP